ncbi:MAG: pyrroline-5-carboxylate reductase [Nitrospirae bacterium]|nr:pyrroline-5-carboxylate reductase [Nitrospirota bacterium]MDA1303195.1 pyrroline-5-carboxylate reductase [Nitrospirota bacterium]
MLKNKKIAIIGAGNIAEALVSGLLKGRVVLPSNIFATDVSEQRRKLFKTRYGVRVGSNNVEAVKGAHVIILAVKPQVIDQVVAELKLPVKSDPLVLSVAAGVPISRLQANLRANTRIIRVMPNTPSIVLAGATAIAGGPGVTPQQLEIGQAIFEAVGKVVVVEESHIDTITGLSGGGPAYVCVFIEALADGGVKMGLPRSVAMLLAAQTVMGTAKMVLESGEHPGVLKDRVASPGGTTIAGLHSLEEGKLRGTVMNAVQSATLRSRELGQLGTPPKSVKSRKRATGRAKLA